MADSSRDTSGETASLCWRRRSIAARIAPWVAAVVSASRLGVPEAELEKIDEQTAGIFQRFPPDLP